MDNHTKIKIAVSGAAAGDCSVRGKELAIAVGRELTKHDCIILTGATTGVPEYVAQGAHEGGGMVIGFSPAASQKQHEHTYKLPMHHHDIIFYSGFGYAHRNTLLTTLSDAVITICGRIGTLNEFTTSFEENKIIGVLLGSGGIADEIPHIIEIAKRGPGHIVYSHDPKELVEKVIEAVNNTK
ncbi:LOG family protein [Candidatus Berkelbacteria bacterium]|nr:LOG family protein [Candidatus Berkelbacteria bacterium]